MGEFCLVGMKLQSINHTWHMPHGTTSISSPAPNRVEIKQNGNEVNITRSNHICGARKSSYFRLDLIIEVIFHNYPIWFNLNFFNNFSKIQLNWREVLLFTKWIHYLIKMNSHYWNSKTFDAKLIMQQIRVESLVSHFQNTYCIYCALHIPADIVCGHLVCACDMQVMMACGALCIPIEHVPTISAVYFDRVYKTSTACISFSFAINFSPQLAWRIQFGPQQLCAVCAASIL